MKKRRIEQFSLCDYEAVQEHLSKMAAKGWLLESVGQYFWTYRRIEPQKLTFAVTYFPEASSFNPEPPEAQRVFYDYCAAAGWEFVAEWFQMQIFCTAAENPPPLETDEALRLETIHKAMKKNFLPSNLLLLGLAVLSLIMQYHSFALDPVSYLSTPIQLFSAAMWLLLAAFISWTVTGYYRWYRRSRKAVAEGGACVRRGFNARKAGSLFVLCFCLGAAVLAVFSIEPRIRLWAVGMGLCPAAIGVILAVGIKNGLKWAGVPGKKGLLLTIGLSFVAILIATGLIFSGFFRALNAGVLDRTPADTYTLTMPDGTSYTRDLYRDELPLTVEDLDGGVSYAHYSYQRQEKSSLFLHYLSGRQDTLPDGEGAPELTYEVVTVKWPVLYPVCRDAYLERYVSNQKDETYPGYERREWVPVDAGDWGAEEAWQRFTGDEPEGLYLICYGDQIILLWYDVPLTGAQIQTAEEKLR